MPSRLAWDAPKMRRSCALESGRATAPIADPFAMIGILIFLEWPRGKPSPKFAQNFSGFLNFFEVFRQVLSGFRYWTRTFQVSSCLTVCNVLDRLRSVCNKWTHFQQIFPNRWRSTLDKHFTSQVCCLTELPMNGSKSQRNASLKTNTKGRK